MTSSVTQSIISVVKGLEGVMEMGATQRLPLTAEMFAYIKVQLESVRHAIEKEEQGRHEEWLGERSPAERAAAKSAIFTDYCCETVGDAVDGSGPYFCGRSEILHTAGEHTFLSLESLIARWRRIAMKTSTELAAYIANVQEMRFGDVLSPLVYVIQDEITGQPRQVRQEVPASWYREIAAKWVRDHESLLRLYHEPASRVERAECEARQNLAARHAIADLSRRMGNPILIPAKGQSVEEALVSHTFEKQFHVPDNAFAVLVDKEFAKRYDGNARPVTIKFQVNDNKSVAIILTDVPTGHAEGVMLLDATAFAIGRCFEEVTAAIIGGESLQMMVSRLQGITAAHVVRDYVRQASKITEESPLPEVREHWRRLAAAMFGMERMMVDVAIKSLALKRHAGTEDAPTILLECRGKFNPQEVFLNSIRKALDESIEEDRRDALGD